MVKKKSELQILLLQIRKDPKVIAEEHQSFADHAGLSKAQIHCHNVFEQPLFGAEILEGYDALFVGGASEASVLSPNTFPFVASGLQLMKDCALRSFPTFASCFGFQLAVLAFGGSITKNADSFEMGTYPISLTELALEDPVYGNIPNNFMAVSVHQEKALTLPEGCRLLAYTQNCCHSFRYKDHPFWAFQFHPELDRQRLSERLTIFKDKYTADKDHFEKIITSLKETPDSNQLVANFINNVLLVKS